MGPDLKRKLSARLRRVQGQVGALERMLSDDEDCVDVLLQISAAQGALAKVGEQLLAHHIETCVAEAFEEGSKGDRAAVVHELVDVFSRYGRPGGK